uniref:Uncharacterized protein n=1 Tax=Arundo donax TaxID=35708 RepID=A0A0A9DYY9_ARUDO
MHSGCSNLIMERRLSLNSRDQIIGNSLCSSSVHISSSVRRTCVLQLEGFLRIQLFPNFL